MKKEEKSLEIENKLDPRQKLTWNNYLSHTGKTFGNAYASAVKAGYSDSHARRITVTPWFRNKMSRTHLLGKAEKILDKILDMSAEDENGKPKADILRIQADMIKHITKTLGKDEGYSERSEVTGKDGNPIVFMPAELITRFNLGEAEKSILE